MNETSLSLLQRLGHSSDDEGWQQLVDLYEPLVRSWLRRYEVQDSDADDLLQEVLIAVSQDLGRFDHGGQPGAFRGWLKQILVNRLRNFWRARDHRPRPGAADIELRLAELDDPASEASLIWNQQHDQHVLRRLLKLTERQFTASTWAAFRRVALEGARADEVARELRISTNAVFIAKSRVLSRLRQEAEGLVEASSGFLANR